MSRCSPRCLSRSGHPNMDSLTKVSLKGITSSFQLKTSCLTRNYGFTAGLLQSLQPQPHKPTKEAKRTPSSQKFCWNLSAPTIPPGKDPLLPGLRDLVDAETEHRPQEGPAQHQGTSGHGAWAS
ncbi:uncharacterized protein ACIQIH_018250 isoform 2-T2 [Cyanocitta cristata]